MFFYKFFYKPRKFSSPSILSQSPQPILLEHLALLVPLSQSAFLFPLSHQSLYLNHILTPSPPSKQALSPYALAHHQNVRLYSTQTQFSLQ